jgi:hypothetical protein
MQMSANLQTMTTTLQTLTCIVQDLVQTTQTMMSVYEENTFRPNRGEKVSIPVNKEKTQTFDSPVNNKSSNNTVDFLNDEDDGPLSTVFIFFQNRELISQEKNNTCFLFQFHKKVNHFFFI